MEDLLEVSFQLHHTLPVHQHCKFHLTLCHINRCTINQGSYVTTLVISSNIVNFTTANPRNNPRRMGWIQGGGGVDDVGASSDPYFGHSIFKLVFSLLQRCNLYYLYWSLIKNFLLYFSGSDTAFHQKVKRNDLSTFL